MEVIELGSYTDEEKLHIARDHLRPASARENGLRAGQLKLGDDALRAIITNYTRESGVRTLEAPAGQAVPQVRHAFGGNGCKVCCHYTG